mmetsp:Transcript_14025/g.59079  ORF Transcript_14025/g.59079 Transcript_14025/m.59079 type:complete len:329 (+) Transcript_14025:555-1541(+)
MARVQCFVASANAYSATAVLPADVCAATNTLSPRSKRYAASFWNASSSNGNVIAGVGATFRNASSTSVKRSITAHCSDFRAGFFEPPFSRFTRLEPSLTEQGTRTERNTASTSSSNASFPSFFSKALSSTSSSPETKLSSSPETSAASDEPASDPSSSSPPPSCASAPVSNALIIRSSCVHGASATRSSPRSFPATDPEPEKSVSFLRVSSSNGFFDSAQGEGANPRGVPANTPASNSASHDALKSLASASRRLAVACAAASQPAPPGVNGCCVVAPRTKSAGAPRRRRSAPRAVSRHPTATSSSSSEAAVSSVSSVSSLCAALRARS